MARIMRKVRIGAVVRTNQDKTAVVEMVWKQRHRLYRKQMRRVARFYVHDPENQCRLGDTVRIEETRPISKSKHWRLIDILDRRQVAEVRPIDLETDVSPEITQPRVLAAEARAEAADVLEAAVEPDEDGPTAQVPATEAITTDEEPAAEEEAAEVTTAEADEEEPAAEEEAADVVTAEAVQEEPAAEEEAVEVTTAEAVREEPAAEEEAVEVTTAEAVQEEPAAEAEAADVVTAEVVQEQAAAEEESAVAEQEPEPDEPEANAEADGDEPEEKEEGR